MTARKTKAITIDAELGERLKQICYDRRVPMINLASTLLDGAVRLLDQGAFPDPDNLTREGMRTWDKLVVEGSAKAGRKPLVQAPVVVEAPE